MGKMTPELMENILKAKTLKQVEEIYKPYKSKKKTKAMIAIEKGFQVVAEIIKLNTWNENIRSLQEECENVGNEYFHSDNYEIFDKYSKQEILE